MIDRLSFAALLLAAACSAHAASSASSELSGSVSTSVGQLSNSVSKSSDSSTKALDVAEGPYRVVELAGLETGGPVTVRLQALADASPEGALVLTLPPVAVERGQLTRGAVVTAKQRPYGVEFATRQTPFFLALHDAWFRELDSKAV